MENKIEQKVSYRVSLFLIISLLLLLLFLGFFLQGYFNYKLIAQQRVDAEINQKKFLAEITVETFQSSADLDLIKYRIGELNDLLKTENISFFRVILPPGVIIYSSLNDETGKQIENFKVPTETTIEEDYWQGEKAKIVTAVSHSGGSIIQLGFLPENIVNNKDNLIRFIVSDILFFLLIFLCLIVLIRIIISPVKRLTILCNEMRMGRLISKPIQSEIQEINYLVAAFNQMINDLKKSRVEIERANQLLEIKVKERTAQLQKLTATLEEQVKIRTKEVREKMLQLEKETSELENSRKASLNILEDVEEARQKTEEEKNKTEAIISNFIDPIIMIDNDWRLALFNPAAGKILRLSANDLGKKLSSADKRFSFDVFREVIKEEYKLKEIETDKFKNPRIEEVTIKNNNIELVYKVMTAIVCDKEDSCFGRMKIFYDLTREKTIDRMKSEFISIAAHQLRTPLSAIKWIIKMVIDGDAGKITKEQEDLLAKGYKSNERIIKLVNDLLNVSRIEEGRFGYNFEKCDFQEVINIVVENSERLISKNHIKLALNKPERLPKVYIDKERIVLVLQNLLDNAIKYTPEYGRIEIRIVIENKYLKITIKDNGVGIPERDKPKLFSKFFRAENALRMQSEGTGLGLFIAKNIIEKHNGNISITSQEGKGTEASFTLPIRS